MFKKFKYLVYDECYPVLFTEADQHKDRAGFNKVTSAGFARLFISDDKETKIGVQCWGESVSLGIKSNPQLDSALIERMFNEGY